MRGAGSEAWPEAMSSGSATKQTGPSERHDPRDGVPMTRRKTNATPIEARLANARRAGPRIGGDTTLRGEDVRAIEARAHAVSHPGRRIAFADCRSLDEHQSRGSVART